ncbi:transcriptional regulator NrdR [Aquaspirillum soli]
MKCPFCGHLETHVIDSRVTEEKDAIRRRRRCLACEKRFTTFETAEVRMPQVVKQGGHRADFSEEKLRVSFSRALHKRPVSTESVDEAVRRIQQKLLASGAREVTSRLIGEMVMKELGRLDKVAYVRFASVYRSFEDVSEFSEAIEELSRGA